MFSRSILSFDFDTGKQIAKETLKQHLLENNGKYPETIAITLWGLDTIKTRGKNTWLNMSLS